MIFFLQSLLLCCEINTETLDPHVTIISLTILSPERPELVLPIPLVPNAKGYAFALKDGSKYSLKFTFTVSNNIVSGLKLTQTVWKSGVKGKTYKLYFHLLQRNDPDIHFVRQCLLQVYDVDVYGSIYLAIYYDQWRPTK